MVSSITPRTPDSKYQGVGSHTLAMPQEEAADASKKQPRTQPLQGSYDRDFPHTPHWIRIPYVQRCR
jgi:hypothetical protein